MKLIELYSITIPKLRIDNPGGAWLRGKREDNSEDGVNQYGSPSRFGPVTASWNRHVLIPIDVAIKCKGLNDEQNRVRKDSLDYLSGHMGHHGKLPPMDNGGQYAPFIMVWQDGTCWVNEGNHRIMSAKKLGWRFIPIEIRYFSGGEAAQGPLHPDEVVKWDIAAQKEGYNPTEFKHSSN